MNLIIGVNMREPPLSCVAKALPMGYWRWANLKPIKQFLNSEIEKGRYKPSLKVGL